MSDDIKITQDLKKHIAHVRDFPRPGILFYDISPLLKHPNAWRSTVEQLGNVVIAHKPDILVGIESRGFLTAAPIALYLNLGFIMVRKKGKLPGKTIRHAYDLEYGSDVIEVQEQGIEPGQRVVILDDLLATGGTMRAAIDLLRKCNADVAAAACIIELDFLEGRKKLDVPVHSLINFAQ